MSKSVVALTVCIALTCCQYAEQKYDFDGRYRACAANMSRANAAYDARAAAQRRDYGFQHTHINSYVAQDLIPGIEQCQPLISGRTEKQLVIPVRDEEYYPQDSAAEICSQSVYQYKVAYNQALLMFSPQSRSYNYEDINITNSAQARGDGAAHD